MKKNKFTMLALSLIVTSLVGCNATDRNVKNMSLQTRLNNDTWNRNSTNNDNLNTRLSNGMTRNNMETNDMLGTRNNMNTNDMLGTRNSNTTTNSMSTRSKNISNKLKNLDEIDDASVVINGDTALVGYKLKNNNFRQTNTGLKQRIESAVKTVDKDIKTVTTTADTDLYDRITTMSKDLEKNPLSDFAQDIEDLLNRMMNPKR